MSFIFPEKSVAPFNHSPHGALQPILPWGGVGGTRRKPVGVFEVRSEGGTSSVAGRGGRARSEEAGSVLRWAVREWEPARLFDFVGGESVASLPARVFSVLLAVCPLKQDVVQKKTAKNAKRQEDRKRHRSLTWTGVNA